jgi:hypothetical protein
MLNSEIPKPKTLRRRRWRRSTRSFSSILLVLLVLLVILVLVTILIFVGILVLLNLQSFRPSRGFNYAGDALRTACVTATCKGTYCIHSGVVVLSIFLEIIQR